MGTQLHPHNEFSSKKNVCLKGNKNKSPCLKGILLFDFKIFYFSLLELMENIERCHDFSYIKTQYHALAQCLGTPIEMYQDFKKGLINGKIGYNVLIATLIEDWIAREGSQANLTTFIYSLRKNVEWASVAGF